jgi:hypothetical protein
MRALKLVYYLIFGVFCFVGSVVEKKKGVLAWIVGFYRAVLDLGNVL